MTTPTHFAYSVEVKAVIVECFVDLAEAIAYAKGYVKALADSPQGYGENDVLIWAMTPQGWQAVSW